MARQGFWRMFAKPHTLEAPIGPFLMLINVKLEANDTEYTSSGNSVYEALTNIPLKYNELKTKGTLWITRGETTVNRFLHLMPLRFLLAGKLRKQGFAKQFEQLLDGKTGKV